MEMSELCKHNVPETTTPLPTAASKTPAIATRRTASPSPSPTMSLPPLSLIPTFPVTVPFPATTPPPKRGESTMPVVVPVLRGSRTVAPTYSVQTSERNVATRALVRSALERTASVKGDGRKSDALMPLR